MKSWLFGVAALLALSSLASCKKRNGSAVKEDQAADPSASAPSDADAAASGPDERISAVPSTEYAPAQAPAQAPSPGAPSAGQTSRLYHPTSPRSIASDNWAVSARDFALSHLHESAYYNTLVLEPDVIFTYRFSNKYTMTMQDDKKRDYDVVLYMRRQGGRFLLDDDRKLPDDWVMKVSPKPGTGGSGSFILYAGVGYFEVGQSKPFPND